MNKQELIEKLTELKENAQNPLGLISENDVESMCYRRGKIAAYEVTLNWVNLLVDQPEKQVVPKEFDEFLLQLKKYGLASESEKVKIPKFVAKWIEKSKETGICFIDAYTKGRMSNEMKEWCRFAYRRELLAKAWTTGDYEVEKEPLYRVKLPTAQFNSDSAELEEDDYYLGFDITSDETSIVYVPNGRTDYKTDLTEDEIKSIDERYWAFAVPVEEEAE